MGEAFVGAVRRYWPGFNRVDYRREQNAADGVHPTATIAAHWGTVIVLAVSIAAIYLRVFIEEKSARIVLLELHRQLGLLVLFVVPVRLALRYWLGFADHARPMAAVLRWARSACHFLLYGGLVSLCLLGWATTNAKNVSLQFLGVVKLPNLAAADPDLADALVDYHTWGFYALLGLITVHVGAALWHHFFVRDHVLTAMLGRRKR